MSSAQRLRMQADAAERFAAQVGEAIGNFRQVDSRTVSTVEYLSAGWESQKKATFESLVQKAGTTGSSAVSIGQELMEQLRQEARRLREEAAELERRERERERANQH
ncbi:hypothetical protein [Aneurinibacillus tyrosinisolvens]|uniref:hypothetical protein n=1 Tax=Aneurinibacillus tyrosinisolvens TaxID=1443435 RepID=UPI000B1284C5|nr:hypothetical protein [Aneurinibacillus tyrosinisolvens]